MEDENWFIAYKNKETKIKRKKSFALNFQTFLFLFLLNLISNSEIRLIIKGNGTQELINNEFSISPSLVSVNGVQKNSCNKTCELEGDINNITLSFNDQLVTLENLFKGLINIIEVDFSFLDCSKVKSISSLFSQCSSLEKVNFGNINTSSVETMKETFSGSSNLKSIDLSNLDFSKVKHIEYMFKGCSKLENINF